MTIEELEAQAAVMREVLEYASSYYHPEIPKMFDEIGPTKLAPVELLRMEIQRKATLALSPTSGRDLLTRLETLEKALDDNKRSREVIEKLWSKYAKTRNIVVEKELLCSEIDCYNDNVIITCGSGECKKMFMEHYFGAGDSQ